MTDAHSGKCSGTAARWSSVCFTATLRDGDVLLLGVRENHTTEGRVKVGKSWRCASCAVNGHVRKKRAPKQFSASYLNHLAKL
jgi:hypothetical protein